MDAPLWKHCGQELRSSFCPSCAHPRPAFPDLIPATATRKTSAKNSNSNKNSSIDKNGGDDDDDVDYMEDDGEEDEADDDGEDEEEGAGERKIRKKKTPWEKNLSDGNGLKRYFFATLCAQKYHLQGYHNKKASIIKLHGIFRQQGSPFLPYGGLSKSQIPKKYNHLLAFASDLSKTFNVEARNLPEWIIIARQMQTEVENLNNNNNNDNSNNNNNNKRKIDDVNDNLMNAAAANMLNGEPAARRNFKQQTQMGGQPAKEDKFEKLLERVAEALPAMLTPTKQSADSPVQQLAQSPMKTYSTEMLIAALINEGMDAGLADNFILCKMTGQKLVNIWSSSSRQDVLEKLAPELIERANLEGILKRMIGE
jgi:hypothetical protein